MAAGFRHLAMATAAAHSADQLLLAALPLILTASGHGPGVIAAVVAAQSGAWLLVSLPAGAMADRLSRRSMIQAGSIAIMAGAAVVLLFGMAPFSLAAGGFLVSAGLVLIVLSTFALLPRFLEGHGIARANAILEFCRAAAALAAPLAAGIAVARGDARWLFAAAAVCGVVALLTGSRVSAERPATGARTTLIASIRDGARFVRDEPILRAIALCAVAWNAAFFAMTAVLAPFATGMAGLGVEDLGRAWACYGAGLLLGAAVAPMALRLLPTGFLFVFGPASSLIGAGLLAVASPTYGFLPMALGLFSVGFGPMLWLVLQTSVRQILTPPHLLGRVAATITTAIYGVRPIAALVAGLVASQAGVGTALWLAVALFALSVIAILRSPAPQMVALPQRAAS